MMMTPQACRRVTSAVAALSAVDQARWKAWADRLPSRGPADVPYEIASIALHALAAAEREIEAELAQFGLDEDREADLLNDLGYVRAIQAALHAENVGH
jgi:hypothetical protein